MTLSEVLLTGVRVFAWAGFAVLALRMSIKDARVQKIMHRELSLGALLAAGAYVLLAGNTLLGLAGYSRAWFFGSFYLDLLIHLALTAAAAVGLWQLRVWPAGDAKLFLLLGAVAPLLTRVPDFQGGRYFFSTLVNVFLPACAFVALQIGVYLWQTRLKHTAGFLRDAGWNRLWVLGRDGAVSAARRNWHRLRVYARGARRYPAKFAGRAATWGAMFVSISGLSALIHSFVPSGAARSAISVVILYAVMRGRKSFGTRLVWAGAAATGLAYVLLPPQSAFRSHLLVAAGSLTVFGFFLQFGVSWTVSLVGGRATEALLPFAGMLFGFVLTLFGAVRSVLHVGESFLKLALLGLFFGLSHVFVRIWESEDRPLIPLDKLRPYMLPHREFLSLAEREDPDFVEIHFSELYADGMTLRQVRAARGWAARRDLPSIPIQTTMSFAVWIFLGYLLTWALGGSLLERLL